MIGSLKNTRSISLAKKANFHITKTSYLIPGKLVSRLEDRKKIAMYQLIDPGIHLEFLESDVPFSKTYKSIWLHVCLFRSSKRLSRHSNLTKRLFSNFLKDLFESTFQSWSFFIIFTHYMKMNYKIETLCKNIFKY